jgi:putative transposase
VELLSINQLNWNVSNSIETEFCLDALEIALTGGRKPDTSFTGNSWKVSLPKLKLLTSWS